MIELEIQTLSERREGLLMEVGRFVTANGFTLQRQRMTQDTHGVLMTMVVRGPPRKQRALEAALDGHERIISFDVSEFVEGDERPHFAASRRIDYSKMAPPPKASSVSEASPPADEVSSAPAPASTPSTVPAEPVPASPAMGVAPPVAAVPEPSPRPEPAIEFLPELALEEELAFFLPPPAAPVAATVVAPPAPFVDVASLDPDIAAVDKAMLGVAETFPQVMPSLLALDRTVAEGAREPSLALAGRRAGQWRFERDHAAISGLSLDDAIERIGLPVLRQLVEVERQGGQLHLRHSPLCTQDGHSGCAFFTGLLEGMLAPALASDGLSIFAVCCRAWGADECVLALSD